MSLPAPLVNNTEVLEGILQSSRYYKQIFPNALKYVKIYDSNRQSINPSATTTLNVPIPPDYQYAKCDLFVVNNSDADVSITLSDSESNQPYVYPNTNTKVVIYPNLNNIINGVFVAQQILINIQNTNTTTARNYRVIIWIKLSLT